jgi:RHS repeat-associated protein
VVTANQQQNGASWQLLGTYSFDAGTATVSLSDDANGYVIADAVMLQPPGAAPNTATWTLAVPSAGTYNVYARWTAHPNRASDAKFSIDSASGSSSVTVNQQQGASGQWNLLGTYGFNAGAASVSLSDQANGYVIADAVMLAPPGAPPNSATWTPSVPAAGSYEVYAWWTANPNRATNATYTVAYSGGTAAVMVNQQTNGGAWNLLGTFDFAPGTGGSVSLTDQANGYVTADAIRLVPAQGQAQPAIYYIVPDHLNTPRLIANQTGTTVWKWDQQEPFGATGPNADPDGDGVAFDFPLRFPGQYFDRESSLAYNYFRDYNSEIGRYVQSDPIGLNAGVNTFSYVLNSPLLYSDPSGQYISGAHNSMSYTQAMGTCVQSQAGQLGQKKQVTLMMRPPGPKIPSTPTNTICVRQECLPQHVVQR